WAEQVREGAEGPVATLVTELAVAPLPQDRADELGGYAHGVLNALLRMGLTLQVAEVKGRLQRMDPTDASYNDAFGDLVRVEARRRLLNESAGALAPRCTPAPQACASRRRGRLLERICAGGACRSRPRVD